MPFGSHPVPDLPSARGRLLQAQAAMPAATAAVAPAAALLSSDRINYLVGEAPSYEVTGAPPNGAIRWTIARDGQPPAVYADPAQKTDSSGHWSGEGGVWTAELTGFYTITAEVEDWSASTCFTVIDGFNPPSGKTAADLVGVVHVGGDYRFAGPGTPFGNATFLVEGAQQILNLGARRGFFYLTPQFQTTDYRFDDFGPGPITSLLELAKSPPYRALFALPLEQFVLTAYTFATWSWILDRAQGGQSVPLVPEAETAEIAELTAYFAQEYPGKQFILKNWEGDWQLKENFDIDSLPAPGRVEEFIRWIEARQAGVLLGRAGAGSVQHAIEFNLLSRSVSDLTGVLHDVVNNVGSDLISYASWQTSSQYDTRRMKDAIAYIERVPGSRGRKVLISEFGVNNNPPDPAAQAHTNALVQAFIDMDVCAFFWEIYNNGLPTGLIGPNYERFETWFALRQMLAPRNDAVVARDPTLTSVPAIVNSGQTMPVTITFSNTGLPWYQAVGYQVELLGPGGADLGQQSWLPRDVAASEQVTFRFDFTAPSEPGTYRFQMAQLGIEVFGESVSFEVRRDG